MMPGLRKSATLAQADTWRKDHRLRLHHACIDHVIQMVNKFGSEDKYLLYADGQVQTQVYTSMYQVVHVYTKMYYWQVRRMRAYLDSLSMDGAEVAINCLCSVLSCPTCWCPDDELADGH